MQRDRHEPLLGAVVQVALEPPALRVPGGDDPLARCLQLLEPRVGLGEQALVLERHGRGRAGGLQQLGILVERCVVHECGDLPPVALDGRDGAAGPGSRRPLQRQLQARITERAPERLLQIRGARRPEPSEEVREPAARQPRSQQPCQEGQRHAHKRAGRDPQQCLRTRPGDQVVDEQRREAQQTERAGDARQQRASAWPRRRPPPGHDHGHRHQGAGHEHAALHLVDRVCDVRVREGEQQVALLGVGHHPRELPDPQRDRVRRDEEAVEARLQPPARQQGQEQRDEREDPVVDEHDPQGVRELALKLAEQGGYEEQEARRDHQQTAAAVRTPAPRDQAARREGAADEREDDLDPLDRRLAVEQDGPEREDLRGRDGDPESDPEPPLGPRRTETSEGGRAGTPRLRHAKPHWRPTDDHREVLDRGENPTLTETAEAVTGARAACKPSARFVRTRRGREFMSAGRQSGARCEDSRFPAGERFPSGLPGPGVEYSVCSVDTLE